jgi:hypothetical protein
MKIRIIIATVMLSGCASSGSKVGRVFIDSPNHKDSSPEWTQKQKVSWESGSAVYFRDAHTVRGNERLNACYDLAKLDAKEVLLTELASDVRGRIDNANTSISESTEIVLGKVRTEEFGGRIVGLKTDETWFERYKIGDDERVDCFVLSKIRKSDYDRVKREVVDKVVEADPRIKEAIAKKQIEFFDNKRNPTSSANE